MKRILSIIAIVVWTLAARGQSPEIFIGGTNITDSANTINISAVTWHDGQLHSLGSARHVNDIFVSNGHLYAVGSNNYQATLWIDTIEQNISIGGHYLDATGIYIANGNVYICGISTGFSGMDAVLLINNNPIDIPRDVNTTLECYPKAIFVENDIVYIAGSASIKDIDTGGEYASLWVYDGNTVQSHILPYRHSSANDIFVAGGKVHLFGTYKTHGFKPVVWEISNINTSIPQYNTQIIENEGDFDVSSGWIVGNNIYMAGGKDQNMPSGSTITPKACLWINGNMTFLADTTIASMAQDIVVFNGQSYIAGTIAQDINDAASFQATLWTNGQSQTLFTGTASSIFLYEHNLLASVHQKSISIYPNPATDRFFIDGFDYDEVKIYDLLGKEVLISGKQTEIDVSNLAKGIYNVRMFDKGKIKAHKKLVKQ